MYQKAISLLMILSITCTFLLNNNSSSIMNLNEKNYVENKEETKEDSDFNIKNGVLIKY